MGYDIPGEPSSVGRKVNDRLLVRAAAFMTGEQCIASIDSGDSSRCMSFETMTCCKLNRTADIVH